MNMIQGLDIDPTAENSDADQYLTFLLAGEEYGVDILRVQEIKGWDSVTQIPNTPAYIKGVINLRGTIVPIVDLRERFTLESIPYGVTTVVINLRGTIVPIVDLRERFTLESIPYGVTTVVIVLRVNGEKGDRIMGIVVDAVSEVYNISEDALKPAPDFGQAISTDFVMGLGTVDDKMIIVLDIDHLLNSSVLDEISKQIEA